MLQLIQFGPKMKAKYEKGHSNFQQCIKSFLNHHKNCLDVLPWHINVCLYETQFPFDHDGLFFTLSSRAEKVDKFMEGTRATRVS
jgi:hypothetical protein